MDLDTLIDALHNARNNLVYDVKRAVCPNIGGISTVCDVGLIIDSARRVTRQLMWDARDKKPDEIVFTYVNEPIDRFKPNQDDEDEDNIYIVAVEQYLETRASLNVMPDTVRAMLSIVRHRKDYLNIDQEWKIKWTGRIRGKLVSDDQAHKDGMDDT